MFSLFFCGGDEVLLSYAGIIIHPRKLTWNLKITHLKRKNIFQAFIFEFHVKHWWYISSFSMVNFCTQMRIIQAAVALAAASVVLENRPSPHLQRKASVLFGEGKRAGVGGKIFRYKFFPKEF